MSSPRELPAQLEAGLEKELREAAGAVAALAGARGVWRIDFLVAGATGPWWVNEVNTIPGSLAKYLWVGEAAVEFPDASGRHDRRGETAAERPMELDGSRRVCFAFCCLDRQ